jgi:hypothetical protein
MKPIWKPNYSVTLSLVVTCLSAALLLLAMIFARSLIGQLLGADPRATMGAGYYENWLAQKLTIIFYACCPAGWAAIASLLKLLHNIRAGKIFTRQNVKLLRLLSWCFVFVALVSLAAMYWDLLMCIFFVAAGFLAVILRVVKNVMAEATALREESDLTI